MKKITLLFALCLASFKLTYAQQLYKLVEITNANHDKIHELQELGFDLTCGVTIKNNKVKLELSEYEIDILESENISYNVLINDMTKFYSERAIANAPIALAELQYEKALSAQRSFSVNEIINNVGQYNECNEIDWATPQNWNLNPNLSSGSNTFGGCLTNDMVLQELDDMRAYSISNGLNIISEKLDMSVTPSNPSAETTLEGRTIYYVRISDNPDIDEAGEPETLYQSLIHSRESATVMNQLFFMWYILENYNSDPAIQNLVKNQALYFVPVYNPDGFVFNETAAPNGGGGQRKNRNLTGAGSCGTYSKGIDLNRNSGYYWGNGGASTTDECNATYAGSNAFSERETQIMRDFFLDHDFEIALNHHSYKNAMLHAYAGVGHIANPRPDEYSKYNHDMTYYNRYAHGPSTSISSLNSGNMNDWMLGGPNGTNPSNGVPSGGTGSGKNTLAWTPENGLSSEGTGGTYGGFWPQPSNFLPIAKRAMRMNFLAAYFSGKYGKLHDLNQNDITGDGNFTFAIENLGQQASDFTVTITPVSGLATVGSAVTESFTAAQVLQQRTISIPYTLNSGLQANDKIEFKVVLTNNYASDNVLYEANIIKSYTPNVLIVDNPDTDNLTNWTSSGSWTTSNDAYSGSTAIISNSSSPYSANQNRTLQLNSTLDLTNKETVLVQYYARWDLERSYDYVVLEGSTDGNSWTELCGKLTKPGAPTANNSYSSTSDAGDSTQKTSTDDARQNGITALYDGDTQDKWNMEEIVIDASNNSFLNNQATVYLRFRFRTDSSNRKDSYANADFEGFTFDDFKVIEISIPCDASSAPTGLAVNNIGATSADATWNNIPSATYDLRYREAGTFTWSNITDITTNSQQLTGLTPQTQYEVQVATKCDSSTSAFSASVNFTTTAVNYCGSQGNSTNDEFIGRVQLNTIDNTTQAAGDGNAPTGYSDHTSISTNLTKGTQYTLTITPTWTDTTYSEGYAAWIDYNGDGDFTDNDEQLFTIAASTNTPASGSFTVPSGVTIGNKRLRVSMKYNGVPTSCEAFSYGEVEDYTVNIQDETLNSESFELSTFIVHPNPFNDGLNILVPKNLKDTDFNINIYDLNGRIVFNTTFKATNGKININNLQNLQKAAYFVKIESKLDGTSITKKLIKN